MSFIWGHSFSFNSQKKKNVSFTLVSPLESWSSKAPFANLAVSSLAQVPLISWVLAWWYLVILWDNILTGVLSDRDGVSDTDVSEIWSYKLQEVRLFHQHLQSPHHHADTKQGRIYSSESSISPLLPPQLFSRRDPDANPDWSPTSGSPLQRSSSTSSSATPSSSQTSSSPPSAPPLSPSLPPNNSHQHPQANPDWSTLSGLPETYSLSSSLTWPSPKPSSSSSSSSSSSIIHKRRVSC